MPFWRRLLAAVTLIIFGGWLAASFELISLTPRTFNYLWTALLVLCGIGIIMDWRNRSENPLVEPSPARSAVTVIVATGLVAAIVAARNASGISGYALATSIMIITGLVAFGAFRFASRNQSSIGEARFNSTSNDS